MNRWQHIHKQLATKNYNEVIDGNEGIYDNEVIDGNEGIYDN